MPAAHRHPAPFRPRRALHGVAAALLVIGSCAPAAFGQSSAELEELKAMVLQMQQTINGLNSRIAELESRQAGTTASAPVRTETGGTTTGDEAPATVLESPSIEALERVAAGETLGRQSPIDYRGSLNDQQEAASRPLDFTLDPQYRGFIPVPNTPVLIKLNAKPRLDMTYDNRKTGTNTRFVPAKFPLTGDPDFGGGGQFNANANGTQLRADVRTPSLDGNFRFYYQNDFFGDDTRDMRYRLQHLYGQYYGLKAGFTYSVWEDPDVWPDTVDYEGPNAVIFARRPVVQYTHVFNDNWNTTLGVEKPDIYVDGGDLLTRMPDLGLNTRWEHPDYGHVQFSTIVRDIGVKDEEGDNHRTTGWGVNLGAGFNLTANDSLQLLGVYGEGVAGMGNDTSFLNSDAGFTSGGGLEALPYWSVLAGLTHKWSPSWRSTVSYGYAHLDPASGQADDFYNFSHYATANLIWQIRPRWSVGIEALYGYKEAVNGDNSDDVFRVQMGMVYSIFD